MKSFAQYEQRKTDILHAYNTVLAGGLLPVEETGIAQVEERRRDLEEGRFLVAVCGRIKAGKSTLLNALLFGDWIVPTDDLPLTAKNTLVEYGLEPSLEVTFFNSSEWDALTRELGEGDRKMAHEFFGEVDEAAARGVSKHECIRQEAVIKRSNDVSQLGKFVTPVAKGGIYTPFVKQVRLVHPHPWLRSVTIADTPGVDDPYKFREDQTKKFVTRAGAVLYVTYAGQAMAQQDFDFLNEYLIHVPPNRRLIAVNKADTLKQGGNDVESYLQSLMNSPEPAIRSVFGRQDSVRMVSALGSLLAEARQHGRPLSEDNEFYRGQLEKSGHLDSERNGIDALRSLVEERLVSQDGESIIQDHARFLTSLFERKRRISQRDLSLLDERLRDLGQTEEQLQVQIGEIQQQLRSMDSSLLKGKAAVKRTCDDLFRTLEGTFDDAWVKTIDNVRKELSHDSDIDGMGGRASWSFNTHFLAQRDHLGVALKACVSGIETATKDFSDELRGAWAGWHSAAYLDDALSYSLYDTLHSLRGVLENVGSAERLEKVREENTIFYQRWFNTQGGRRAASSAIVQTLRSQLEPAIRAEFDRVKDQLQAEVIAQLDKVSGQLKEVQHTRLTDIEKLTQGKADRGRERDAVAADISKINHSLAGLVEMQASLREQLAG